jgi:hypothetical protein
MDDDLEKRNALIIERDELDNFFNQVNSVLPQMEQELIAANSAGDVESEQRIANEIIILREEAESKSDRYADLKYEIETAPELTKIQQASEQLRSGGYKQYTDPNAVFIGMRSKAFMSPKIDVKKTREALVEQVSVLTNTPKERVNPQNELPASDKFALGAIQSPEMRARYLATQNKNFQILPIDIDGKTEFALKKPDGSVFTTAEGGFSGFAGAAIVEVPILAAEVATFSGTLGATKSPTISLAASSGVRAVGGAAIDAGIEKAFGLDPQWFNAFTRRGTEAAIGLVSGATIDKATSKYLANRVAPEFANNFAKELQASVSRLGLKESKIAATAGRPIREITVPIGAELGGPVALQSQQFLAGEVPTAGFVGSMKRTQETIRYLWDGIINKTPINPQMFRQVADQQRKNQDAIASEISKRANMSEGAVKSIMEQQSQRFANIVADEDALGKTLLQFLNDAEEKAVQIKNETFNKTFGLANNAGFSISPQELLEQVSRIRREEFSKGAANDAAAKSVEARLFKRANSNQLLEEALEKANKYEEVGKLVPFELQKEIDDLASMSGPIDAFEFDRWIREMRDSRPDEMAGASTKDQFSGKIATRMSEYRRSLFDQYNTTMPDGTSVNIGKLYDDAVNVYNQRMSFERNLLGRVLKEDSGETKMFPREVVSAVMSEPTKIQNVINAIRQYELQDPQKAGIADSLIKQMQAVYFDRLGFGRPGVNVSSVKYDRNMMRELWGGSADRIMKSMDELTASMKTLKAGANITYDDVARMSSALDEKTRKNVIKQIALRNQAEQKLEALQSSEIFKLAKKGDFKSIDPDALSKSILSESSTASDVEKIMLQLGKMSTSARNLYKGDFMRALLQSFPGGASPSGAPYTPMFDTDAFVKAWQSPVGKSTFRRKLETVLGKNDAQFLYDLANVYNANTIKNVKDSEFLRATTGTGGNVSVYLAHGIASDTRNRINATLLTIGSKRKSLVTALAKNSLPGQVDNVYRQMLKDAFTTRSGLMSLANQASNDEEFSSYLIELGNQFIQDDEELSRIMGEER